MGAGLKSHNNRRGEKDQVVIVVLLCLVVRLSLDLEESITHLDLEE